MTDEPMRAAFEAWANGQSNDLEFLESDPVWQAWQAAIATAAPAIREAALREAAEKIFALPRKVGPERRAVVDMALAMEAILALITQKWEG